MGVLDFLAEIERLGYIRGILVKIKSDTYIDIAVGTNVTYKNTIINMVEANLYTRPELQMKEIRFKNGALIYKTYDDISVRIDVIDYQELINLQNKVTNSEIISGGNLWI